MSRCPSAEAKTALLALVAAAARWAPMWRRGRRATSRSWRRATPRWARRASWGARRSRWRSRRRCPARAAAEWRADKAAVVAARQAAPPPEVRIVLNGGLVAIYGTEEHKRVKRAVAAWIVEAHVAAHNDPVTKRLARLVLGVADFAENMSWAHVWDAPYKAGLREKLLKTRFWRFLTRLTFRRHKLQLQQYTTQSSKHHMNIYINIINGRS